MQYNCVHPGEQVRGIDDRATIDGEMNQSSERKRGRTTGLPLVAAIYSTKEIRPIMQIFRFTALMALTSLAVGCASPVEYQPAESNVFGAVVGYSEEKLSDKQYRLTYSAGVHGKQVQALEAWRRRADELCPGGHDSDPKISLRARESLNVYGWVYVARETVQRPLVVGLVTCK